jgi:hypothetical protein
MWDNVLRKYLGDSFRVDGFFAGNNSDAFEQSWSVIVKMVSYLSDTGSFVMKSSAIV